MNQALKSDAVFVAKAMAYCALAGVGLVLICGPLIVLLRIQWG